MDEIIHGFYSGGWNRRNPRAERLIAARRGSAQVLTQFDLFSASELEQLPIHAEFINPHGYRWFAAAVLTKVGPTALNFSVHRRTPQEPFSSDEVGLLTALLPHLQQGARLAANASGRRGQVVLDTLDEVGRGCILIDSQCRVIAMNAKAETYLDECIDIRSGKLAATDPISNANLHRALEEVLRVGPDPTRAPVSPVPLARPSRGTAILCPLPLVRSAQDIFMAARAMVIITDPSVRSDPPEGTLREVFGLTRAEIRVALHLARGDDLKQIAEATRTSVATVRTQVRSLLHKTGTHRQAELSALLARFGATALKN
jgi:DNA-binding CsgD family transcriptional regulator